MRYSEQVDKLFAALAAFQGEITPPPQNRTVEIPTNSGSKIKFNYAELGAIWTHVKDPWKKNQFFWISDVQLRDGKHWLTTRIGHASGQWFESDYPLPAPGNTKQFAGEITYGRRYSFSMMMGISNQEDAEEIPGSKSHQDRPPQESRAERKAREAASRPQDGSGRQASPAAQAGAASHSKAIAPVGSGGAAATQAPASATPQIPRPGQKEREALVELAEIQKWPVGEIPKYLQAAYHVSRLEQLTMEQYAEVMKVVAGPMPFAEVMELHKPKPGDFNYRAEPGADG